MLSALALAWDLFLPAGREHFPGRQGLLANLGREIVFFSLNRTDKVLLITVIIRLVPSEFIYFYMYCPTDSSLREAGHWQEGRGTGLGSIPTLSLQTAWFFLTS